MSTTTYVILRRAIAGADIGVSGDADVWEELGSVANSSAQAAVRTFVAAQKSPRPGTYKAVPAANFRDIVIEVSASPVVTVKGAPAA